MSNPGSEPFVPRLLPSYGRKRGKKLKPRKAELWQNLLPQMLYDGKPRPSLHLEIGYGSGEYLAQKAKLYPERNYIGCEVYENGIATMLSHIEKNNLKNVQLYTEDARLLLQSLPAQSVAGADILFADPWPKRKHNKRRIINPDTLDLLSKLMPSGAPLFLATDHYEYLQWIMVQMMAREDFIWDGNWRTPPADYVMTRYEAKARADGNNDIHYLQFVRA
jgi:tRNA (guanine-N7-)-methyltransferase